MCVFWKSGARILLNLAHFIFSPGFILHLRLNKLSRFSLDSAWVRRGSAWVQMHPLDPVHPLLSLLDIVWRARPPLWVYT